MKASTNTTPVIIRIAAALAALSATFVIAAMLEHTLRNWNPDAMDRVPYIFLLLFGLMLALLCSSFILLRRWQDTAFVVFMVAALMGLNLAGFWFAIVFFD
jgi:hypothetical protein